MNKLVLVIGGGNGIGAATCHIYANNGYNVIVADIDEKAAENVCKQLKSSIDDNCDSNNNNYNNNCKIPHNSNNFHSNDNNNEDDNGDGKQQEHYSIYIDVKQMLSIVNCFEMIIKKYKQPPSIIINSAGDERASPLLKMSEIDFINIIDLHLIGIFRVTQIAAKHLINFKIKDSCIINISSVGGQMSFLENCNYCASKAGLNAFTKVAAKELAVHGIRVTSISPGIVKTETMLKYVSEEVLNEYTETIPLKRLGTTNEIAEIIFFLSSAKCAYVTGSDIHVAGGFTC